MRELVVTGEFLILDVLEQQKTLWESTQRFFELLFLEFITVLINVSSREEVIHEPICGLTRPLIDLGWDLVLLLFLWWVVIGNEGQGRNSRDRMGLHREDRRALGAAGAAARRSVLHLIKVIEGQLFWQLLCWLLVDVFSSWAVLFSCQLKDWLLEFIRQRLSSLIIDYRSSWCSCSIWRLALLLWNVHTCQFSCFWNRDSVVKSCLTIVVQARGAILSLRLFHLKFL